MFFATANLALKETQVVSSGGLVTNDEFQTATRAAHTEPPVHCLAHRQTFFLFERDLMFSRQ